MIASNAARDSPHRHAREIFLSGLAVLAIAVYALYPGWYTFDSAYILHQARTGTFSNLQPPVMGIIWRHLIETGAPPGSLLVANLAAYAAGAVMLGLAVRSAAGVLIPALLLWPPFLAVFGHLWIDVNLAASLVLATGWIAWTRSIGRTGWSWLAAVALTYAVCVRHNAVCCVPPFYYLLVSQTPGLPQRVVARLALAILLAVASYGISTAVTWITVGKSVPAWSPTAIWDLSAASVGSGEMLLPDGMHGPGLTVDELRQVVNPDESTSLLMGTRSGINSGILEPLPDGVRRELFIRWVGLPFTHTRIYFRHRLEVARSLFGIQLPQKPDALFVEPGVMPFRDNPPIERNENFANAALLQAVRSMRNTVWGAPLAYLMLSVVAIALAWRYAFAGDRAMVACLAASAWCSAVPLLFLVPSSDWRYALWPVLSATLAFALAVSGSPWHRKAIPAAAAPHGKMAR